MIFKWHFVAGVVAVGLLAGVVLTLHTIRPRSYADTLELKSWIEASDPDYFVYADGSQVRGLVISKHRLEKDDAVAANHRRHGTGCVSIFDRPELFDGVVYAVNLSDNEIEFQDTPNARVVGNVYLVGDAAMIAKLNRSRP